MLGKILIVDQIATNRIVLRAKLGAAQFDVSQAATVTEAVALAARYKPDLILTTEDLADGRAEDLIRQVQAQYQQPAPPIVVLTQSVKPDTRLDLLSSGASDVIEKPFNDQFFLARLRSLVRMANADAEWFMRDDTSRALGCAEPATRFHGLSHVRIVGDDLATAAQVSKDLAPLLKDVALSVASAEDVLPAGSAAPRSDAFLLLLGNTDMPAMLRLLSSLRCHKASRHAAIYVIQDVPEHELGAYALDMGASDLSARSDGLPEIALRLEAILQRKHLGDQLRASVRSGLEAAVSDPLTGLHNRRYAMPHMRRMLERATQTRQPVAIMIADMDHFKRINDTHGHAAGDAVLVETADRLRQNMRAIDLVARIGGEEFLIVMPGITLENACRAAERLCTRIHEAPYRLPDDKQALFASISIGLTLFEPLSEDGELQSVPSPQFLLDRADHALYKAKEKGRNGFRLSKPAA